MKLENQTSYLIRAIRKLEYPLLEDFLYEAIFVPVNQVEKPPKSIIYEPELWRSIDKFGDLNDDYCFIAEIDHKVVGAVWVRITEQYGYVDEETPSLGISLYGEYRGRGIGTALMRHMLEHLKNKGYKRVSLSVQKENYAVTMYENLGFHLIQESDDECIMICDFSSSSFLSKS